MSEAVLQNLDIRQQVSAEEWAIRQDLAAAYRLVANYGWDDMVFTHLSARVPGPDDHFLLNPYGFQFSEVTASNLVKVDLDGNVVLDNGFEVNAAGFTIHSAVHMARHDAGRSCTYTLTLASRYPPCRKACYPLPARPICLPRHCLSRLGRRGLDLDERERVVADLGNKHLMMLRNHGTLALGWHCGFLLHAPLLHRAGLQDSGRGDERHVKYAQSRCHRHDAEYVQQPCILGRPKRYGMAFHATLGRSVGSELPELAVE
jgi:ribulose-5-phosphate 4-epimerase/fuculose-1-phosphate aldolase